MNNLFNECSLVSIDLSSFNTKSVKDMSFMFFGCTSLVSIDLSKFSTSNVKYMNNMFADCLILIYLDISGLKRNDSPSSNYRDFFNDKIPSKGTIILSSSIYKK